MVNRYYSYPKEVAQQERTRHYSGIGAIIWGESAQLKHGLFMISCKAGWCPPSREGYESSANTL